MRRLKKQEPPAQNQRRQPPKRRWLKPMLAGGAVVTVVSLIGAGLWWLDREGHIRRAHRLTIENLTAASADLGLVVADITVEGRKRQDTEALLKALGLNRGDAILSADLEMMRRRLETLPWVSEAIVERRLPGRLHVRLAEREPMALWQRNGQFVLVDRQGAEIGPDLTGEFQHLPVIVGADAPSHAGALFAALSAEPALAPRVKAAVRVGGRRWNLKLDDIASGIDVRLPEAQTAAAWTRLARLERDYQLLERNLMMIDLRLPDRLVVGAPEDAAVDPKAVKKNKPHDKDA
ncbi:MAG: FtsQ-type POTRA domain-containing protein [Rhodospirillales bacterium]|jgi:cell division protein FtsQ|nr:FtsQ-type POTRA domain-containing protein [Rhodospirillales bacterium]